VTGTFPGECALGRIHVPGTSFPINAPLTPTAVQFAFAQREAIIVCVTKHLALTPDPQLRRLGVATRVK